MTDRRDARHVGSDGPGRVPTFDEVVEHARHVEDAGLDSIWVCDHLLSHPTDDAPAEGIVEAWTLLAALAARTERVELGQLVTCVSFRNPAILAKMATTVDEISGGRVTLGLGAGWDDREYRAFGVPIDHRVDRFEEALQVIVPLLRGERVTIDGTYHHANDLVLLPRPTRRVPTLIAADGPRMLRLTARHADAWNTAWYGAPSDALRAKLAEMDAALEAEGRDPAGLRRTVGMSVVDPERPGTNEVGPGRPRRHGRGPRARIRCVRGPRHRRPDRPAGAERRALGRPAGTRDALRA